jgi:hypothetical protein
VARGLLCSSSVGDAACPLLQLVRILASRGAAELHCSSVHVSNSLNKRNWLRWWIQGHNSTAQQATHVSVPALTGASHWKELCPTSSTFDRACQQSICHAITHMRLAMTAVLQALQHSEQTGSYGRRGTLSESLSKREQCSTTTADYNIRIRYKHMLDKQCPQTEQPYMYIRCCMYIHCFQHQLVIVHC